ncbi:MAG: hypothetical protein KGI27_11320 [Thaumarchaeota archaeon]|nr:hypothetical protein [Nitrososphaerota archaeon]
MKTLYLSIIAILLLVTGTSNVFGQNQNTEQTVHIIIPSGSATPRCSPLCFVPEDVTVTRGTVVDWVNKDLVPHDIASGQASDNQTGTIFDSGLIQPGRDFQYKFDRTGTYNYFDLVHPWATGIIRVSDSIHSNIVPRVITARTDRDSYYGWDAITITGATNGYIPDSDVLITIKDPHKNTIMKDDVPLQQDSNSYLAKIIAGMNFTESGTYEIDARYGTAQFQTFFDFNTASPEKILQIKA